MDEFDYRVTNIAIDLRDGIRLAKVADILRAKGHASGVSCVAQLRVPAVSRLQKIHNTDVALKCLREELHVPVQDIASRDIVDGHRSKTLMLLWKIILMSEVPSLLTVEQLSKEISDVQRNNFQAGLSAPQESELDLSDEAIQHFQSPLLSALLRWCQTVCVSYGLHVNNFTSSFSDGKVLCAIINYYFSEALDWKLVRRTTRDLHKDKAEMLAEQEDKPIDGNWVGVFSPPARVSAELKSALEGEKTNFQLVHDATRQAGMIPCLFRAFGTSESSSAQNSCSFVSLKFFPELRYVEYHTRREGRDHECGLLVCSLVGHAD